MGISQLCTPSMVYFVLSLIGLLINVFKSFNIVSLVVKGFFVVVWSWFLNYLCSKGYATVSWLLVLLPLFIIFI